MRLDYDMARLGVITFSLFYLLVSSGVVLNLHFCKGKIVDIAAFSDVKSCCAKKKSCGKEDMPGKCCHDETVVIQFDQWQVQGSSITLDLQGVFVADVLSQYDLDLVAEPQTKELFYDLPPPKPRDLWKIYNRLIFYG